MNTTRTRIANRHMSRIAAALGVIAGVATMLLLLPAQAAFAYVPPPDPSDAGIVAMPATTVITHNVSQSGLATWTILVIAVGAVAVGVALTELTHAARRRYRSRQPLMASGY